LLHRGIYLTTEENHGKTITQGDEIRPASQQRARFDVDLSAIFHAASIGRLIP
jgi:hypothetical protein